MPEQKKTVLVTGGAGYVGSHCVLLLLTRTQHQVVVIDNCCNAYYTHFDENGNNQTMPESLRRVELMAGRQLLEFAMIDLQHDHEALDGLFKRRAIDVVIHFAALKAVGESCKFPLNYYENNVCGSVRLFKTMERFGCYNMIFSSSATVYGTPKKLPLNEDSPTGVNISNPYGRTKYMIEEILHDLCLMTRTEGKKLWDVISLRYFNPVGAHPTGLIGEHPQGTPNNLMPYISQVAVGKRDKLYVYGNDFKTSDGTGVRDYIHIMDLAHGHLAALDKLLTESNTTPGWRTYNLGTGQGSSVLELVKTFERASGVKIPYEIVGRRHGDVDEIYADASKARRELNWEAKHSIFEMCRDTYNWQSRYPDGFKTPIQDDFNSLTYQSSM